MSDNATRVVWFEVPVDETDRGRMFYGQLMGWEFQPANGRNGPMVYFGTDDIEASVRRVRELRGSANEAQEIPGVGRYAECSDPDGNAFGFYQVAGVAE